MKEKVEVIPAIIPENLEDVKEHLIKVQGVVNRVQIDVIDGAYAPTKTWPIVGDRGEFKRIVEGDEGLPLWEDFLFEIDLMVIRPEEVIEQWFQAGAQALIIHAGSTTKLREIREKLTEWDIEMGIAYKPSEDIQDEYVQMADFIQIMGNDRIGYHGVGLDERVYEKVSELRKKYPELSMAVDIGVDEETAPRLVEVGVTKLVSGSTIFKSEDIEKTINWFTSL